MTKHDFARAILSEPWAARMAVVALSSLGLAVTVTSAAAQEAPAVQAPGSLDFKSMSYAGPLCPPGSLPSDIREIMAFPDSLGLQTDGRVESSASYVTKYCQLVFDVVVPTGYQFRGIDIQADTRARLKASNYSVTLISLWDTGLPDPGTKVWGASSGDGEAVNSVASSFRDWSPSCGPNSGPLRLAVYIEATAGNNMDAPAGTASEAHIALEQIAVSANRSFPDLNWRRCDGTPL